MTLTKYTKDDFEGFVENYFLSGKVPKTLVIEYADIAKWDSKIAEDILETPAILKIMEDATRISSQETVPISIKNLPSDVSLRALGSNYLNKLILIRGIVNRVVPIRPFITKAVFECKKCKVKQDIIQDEAFMVYPYVCGAGQGRGKCRYKRFRFIEDESSFVDVQELRIQERPEDLPAGQLPRQVTLEISRGDLVNGARAGDIVDVVGVLKTKASSPSSKKRKFAMFLEVNYVESLNKEISEMDISPEEEQEICSLALKPNIYDLIIASIAPSIFGNERIKEAMMYLLFGGVKKDKGDLEIRGEMNVLLVGDPATGKSQLLQILANISPRGLYTSGRGTTAAGLTAAVNKVEGDVWALDAGALVLADRGICCIDEIDKMNANDRVAIHEAMEQHKISINKAGINARLNARTAVFAAANPDFGRYDPYKTVAENIKKLPVALLSRFDLMFILKDKLKTNVDRELSSHILGIDKVKKDDLIDVDLLKKYIGYARNLSPKMTKAAKVCLQKFYQEMRDMSNGTDGTTPVAITPRQLESLMRITEAHAKIALKRKAGVEDALAAIKIMQKSLKEVGVDPETNQPDVDVITTGIPKTVMDRMSSVLGILGDDKMHEEDIILIMEKKGVEREDVCKILNRMLSSGKIYNPEPKVYKRGGW